MVIYIFNISTATGVTLAAAASTDHGLQGGW